MALHRIQSGDTLSALAKRFNTTVDALAKANNIKNPDLIYAGDTLKVPGKQDSFEPGGPGGSEQGPRAGRRSPVDPGGELPTGTGGSRALAEAGRRAALGMGGYNSQGLCATGVSRAIQDAMGIKVWGNGNQIDNNLPSGKFRQVNMSLEEALKTPGLVLTWEKTSSRLGSIYGHTAITSGDGRSSYSDFIERNTLAAQGGRSGLKIFVPI